LKCAAPYDKTTAEWVVIELGGGSTQISRFLKEKKDDGLKKAAETEVE
jgi:exopolyphosphatase/pppGpp-phosphohydrolase